MVMRFDVEFFGGAIVGLIIGLAIGLSIGQSRADCTGCAAGKAYEDPCLSWWTLPDGERICVEQPGQLRVLRGKSGVLFPPPRPKCEGGDALVAFPTSVSTFTWMCAVGLKEPRG